MIQIENLSKSFGGFRALDDICLEVAPGSVFGLIGPNGAGKTTLIKTMVGVLTPDIGWVRLDGCDVHADPGVKVRVGYIADYQSYYPHFQVRDMIRFYRESYPHWNETRFAKLSGMLDLPPRRRVCKLSKGMRTQLAVLLNLSLMPTVLVLDEPTSGLDPVLRRQVLRLLMDEVALHGTTILMATHQLHELERICDHVGIIHNGRLLFDEALEQMKGNIRKVQAVFETELPAEFAARPEVLAVERRGRVYTIVVRENLEGVKADLVPYGPLLLEDIDLSLEDIFTYRMGGLGYAFEDLTA